jgi:SPOR domain
MSVRVDSIENDISSIVGQLSRPARWRWWERRRALEGLAVREATELLNQFGKDAYWLACICARRSRGELGRHWQAVAVEIEQRTGRKSPRTTADRLRAALGRLFAPAEPEVPRLDAYHAGAPDDFAGARRAAPDRGDYSDRGAAMGPHDEEMDDNPPRKERRRGLVVALALIGCATVGTAGAYAYWTYSFVPGSTQTSAAAPSQAEPAQTEPAQPVVHGYVVQVSARRSQAEAEASFRWLQSKFPRQLGGRTAIVQRADLGAKGIFYRSMVGPFASAGEAEQFCGSLKAARGQCSIQRN